MPQRSRPRANPLVRIGLVATLLGLAAGGALPVAAGNGGRLDHAAVAPAEGTTATPFALSVRYRDGAGIPAAVRVSVGGTWRAMTPTSTTWGSGVVFTLTTTLPAGAHGVTFEARSESGVEDVLVGPTVVVTQLAPTPTPTPPPTPTPTPTPTPRPSATPAPTATSVPTSTARPTPTSPGPSDAPMAPTPGATEGPDASPSDSPSPDASSPAPSSSGDPAARPIPAGPSVSGAPATPFPSAAIATPGTSPSSGAGSGDPDSSDGPSGAPAGGTGGGPGTSPAGDPGGTAANDPLAALAAFGVWGGSTLDLSLAQAFVVSTGAATMAMAFMFFGKRRRDGEPTEPDDVLRAEAASAPGGPADATLAEPPVDPDLLMPRWRRPSLLQARKADPVRDATPVVPMSFADAGAAPAEDVERRLIRYHVVELLDAPDELRSRPVGSLTHGDEVQLLERSGAYWRVLCPDGREGWLHRMTLGEQVGSERPPSPVETWSIPAELLARLEPKRAPEPEPALFSAFLAARRADA